MNLNKFKFFNDGGDLPPSVFVTFLIFVLVLSLLNVLVIIWALNVVFKLHLSYSDPKTLLAVWLLWLTFGWKFTKT